jgi:hypothetical protein
VHGVLQIFTTILRLVKDVKEQEEAAASEDEGSLQDASDVADEGDDGDDDESKPSNFVYCLSMSLRIRPRVRPRTDRT